MQLISIACALFVLGVLALYCVVPKKYRWIVLLLASLLFYYWVGGYYPVYLLCTSAVTYLCALAIHLLQNKASDILQRDKDALSREDKKALKQKFQKKEKAFTAVGIVISIGLLVLFKYTGFITDNLNLLLSGVSDRHIPVIKLVAPLGISYYTFQTVGYLIDVYRGTVQAQRNPFRYLLFASYFPQIIQGPINRYAQLRETLYQGTIPDFSTIKKAAFLILWGLAKKNVVGDNLNLIVANLLDNPEQTDGLQVFIAVMVYGVQLYADFSGYMDIVRGISMLFGVEIARNFERPYFSKSLAEHWRRWHITLGEWMRDYVFYSVLRSALFTKIAKKKRDKAAKKAVSACLTAAALFVVWLMMGIWHGASWNFIIFGLGNGAIIIFSFFMETYGVYARVLQTLHISETSRGLKWFRVARTYVIKALLSCFFFCSSIPDVLLMFRKMATDLVHIPSGISYLFPGLSAYGLPTLAVTLLMCAALLAVSLLSRSRDLLSELSAKRWWVQAALMVLLFCVSVYFKVSQQGISGVFIYEIF